MDVDLAVLQVDVRPLERLELTGARSEVDRDRHQPAPLERHHVRLGELQQLSRKQERFRALPAAIGSLDI
ncbi:MAG: hypothetical protein R3B89_17125 [Polyangiaceae bacterium]